MAYKADVKRAIAELKGPGQKAWKAFLTFDPFKLLVPLGMLLAYSFFAGVKILFFSAKKLFNLY